MGLGSVARGPAERDVLAAPLADGVRDTAGVALLVVLRALVFENDGLQLSVGGTKTRRPLPVSTTTIAPKGHALVAGTLGLGSVNRSHARLGSA